MANIKDDNNRINQSCALINNFQTLSNSSLNKQPLTLPATHTPVSLCMCASVWVKVILLSRVETIKHSYHEVVIDSRDLNFLWNLMQLRNAKHVAELSTFREIKDAGLSTNLTAQMIRLNRAAVVYNACICKANGHEIWGQLILPLSHFNKNNVSISSHGDCEWRWR